MSPRVDLGTVCLQPTSALGIKMALQCAEIERHKFFLSRESGRDVGMQMATEHWNATYGPAFCDMFTANYGRIRREVFALYGRGCGINRQTAHEILGEWSLQKSA